MSTLLRPAAAALLLLTFAAVAPAVAQTAAGTLPPTFADDITVTATGIVTDAIEVPVPTTVITKQEMEDAQAENVADILRRVPGLTVLRSGDEGKVASVFTRGTESDQTLVLFDGVRLNSPYVGGYDVGLLTTSGIERVEVARGPYSALWGADAIGGVINVIPQVGLGGFSATLLGEGGGDGWQRYQGDLTLGGETFGLFLSGLHREGESALDNSDFTTDQQLVDVGWSFRDGSRLAVVGQNLETETGIPFAVPGQPTPERRQLSDERLIAVPLRWAIGRVWTLELTASEVTREFRFSDPDDPFGITDSRTDADTRQARFSSHHILGTHTLTWGGEWREDEVTDVSNLGTNLDGRTTEVTSAFVQEVWRAGDRVQLIAGTRWDDTEEWGSETSPRAHIGWQLSDTVEMRVGYGKAFRQPSLGELYFPIYGNPELEPETSSSYEIGFVQAPKKGTEPLAAQCLQNRARGPDPVRLRLLDQPQHRPGGDPRRRAGLRQRPDGRLLPAHPADLARHRGRRRRSAAAPAGVERWLHPDRIVLAPGARRPHRALPGVTVGRRPGHLRARRAGWQRHRRPGARLAGSRLAGAHRAGRQPARSRVPGGARLPGAWVPRHGRPAVAAGG